MIFMKNIKIYLFSIIIIFLIVSILILKKYKSKNTIFCALYNNLIQFLPILLLVFIIRSFLIQPYKVPTGSLEPTIIPTEFIIVNQFAYGIKLPILNINIFKTENPNRGDIALFYFPKDNNFIFIKRVIGLPGDHIIYKNKILFINGIKIKQELTKFDIYSRENNVIMQIKKEYLFKSCHYIQMIMDDENEKNNNNEDVDLIVPKDSYFVMGDNRDYSYDSRYWGFVPKNNFIGKAIFVWFSYDNNRHCIRWSRMFKLI